MASGMIPVPHKPEFHAFTLPTGITAQPAGANNGYYLFPDGKVRIEVNVKGLTANTSNTIVSDFPYPPTKVGSYGSGVFGNDANSTGAGKGMTIQSINDGVVRVISTSQYAQVYVEYYP